MSAMSLTISGLKAGGFVRPLDNYHFFSGSALPAFSPEHKARAAVEWDSVLTQLDKEGYVVVRGEVRDFDRTATSHREVAWAFLAF